MADLLANALLLTIFIVVVTQPIYVAVIAARKGRDGAAWFLVVALWLVVFGSIATVWGFGNMMVILLDSDKRDFSARILGTWGVMLAASLLPFFAIACAGNRSAPRRTYRRRGRRIA